jgi:hypothetical protein
MDEKLEEFISVNLYSLFLERLKDYVPARMYTEYRKYEH